jgi:hypothetical protein
MIKSLLSILLLLSVTNIYSQLFDDMKEPEAPTSKVFNIEPYLGVGMLSFSYDHNLPQDPNDYVFDSRSRLTGIAFPTFGINMVAGTKRIRGGGSFESTTLLAKKSILNSTSLNMTLLKFAGRGEYSFTFGKKSSWGGALQVGSFVPIGAIGKPSSFPVYFGLGLVYKLGISPKLQLYFEEAVDFYWLTTQLRNKNSSQNLFIGLLKIGLNFGG